jgi:hypothetical protein
MISKLMLFLSLCFAALYSQSNVWTKITGNQIGVRWMPGIVYVPHQNEFVMTLGTVGQNGENAGTYSVMTYADRYGKWINSLPDPALYGVWADSTGNARNLGSVGGGVFGSPYWSWKEVMQGGVKYLRPNLGALNTSLAYGQYTYNPEDHKIYGYMGNSTFTYNVDTRRWDTLQVTHPNNTNNSCLRWGSLCYDPINHEVLLFGGGAVDKPYGNLGTWTFKPSTRTWTKLTLSVEPPARANSALVYDAKNQIIILFGGDRLDAFTADTWVYQCATRTWVRKHPAISPSPRAGHALLYLPKSQKIVLIGGYLNNWESYHEMWKYDVAADEWKLVKRFAEGQTFPVVSCEYSTNSFMAVDTSDRIIALTDSSPSPYIIQPHTYSMPCDPSVTDEAGTITYGVDSAHSVRYQWPDLDPALFDAHLSTVDTAASEAFLRALPLNTWTIITPPKVPFGYRFWGTTIYAPEKDLIIRWSGGHSGWCGNDVPQYSPHTNRWRLGYYPEFPVEWAGKDNPSPGPFSFQNRSFMVVHSYATYDYDPNLGMVVVLGSGGTHLYDPDSMKWVETLPAPCGGGRATNLTYTPHGVFANSSGMFTGGASALYIMDAAIRGWRKINSTGPVPDFDSDGGGLVYDSKRDRVLYFVTGGSTAPATVSEFRFSDSVVARLSPANSTLAMNTPLYRECVYLPHQDMVLFQIRTGNSHLVYDCANNTWSTYDVAAESGIWNPEILNDRNAGYMYDRNRNLVWFSGLHNQSWAFRPDSQALSAAGKSRKPVQVPSISAMPNPFNPAVTIKLEGGLEKGSTILIHNLMGKKIADLSQAVSDGEVVWNPGNISAGMYVVTVKKGATAFRQKIVLAK